MIVLTRVIVITIQKIENRLEWSYDSDAREKKNPGIGKRESGWEMTSGVVIPEHHYRTRRSQKIQIIENRDFCSRSCLGPILKGKKNMGKDLLETPRKREVLSFVTNI